MRECWSERTLIILAGVLQIGVDLGSVRDEPQSLAWPDGSVQTCGYEDYCSADLVGEIILIIPFSAHSQKTQFEEGGLQIPDRYQPVLVRIDARSFRLRLLILHCVGELESTMQESFADYLGNLVSDFDVIE